jgi:hypothetical protein
MTTQFRNFRLSFIWVETIPAIFAQKLGADAAYAFLGRPGGYAEKFNTLQGGGAVADLQLAWPRPQGHHFWKHYFAGRHSGSVSGVDAWKKHVPLRGTTPINIVLDVAEPKATFEIFYMPQGIGLVANVYYRSDGGSKLLDDIVKLALGVRYRYRFRRSGEPPRNGRSLESMANHVLADARAHAFGKADAFAGSNLPFTVATFVQGETDHPDDEVPQGGPVHRALEALTGWNEKYATMNLEKALLASARLAIHTRAESDLVYARKSGRAIWLPREFADASAHPRLSCYHRNLTLASLQTMSLGEFVGLTARQLQRGEKVSQMLLARAKSAAGVLSVLASGERQATYRTMSIDAQTKAGDWAASIDIINNSF